jgi:hypothetical protein
MLCVAMSATTNGTKTIEGVYTNGCREVAV